MELTPVKSLMISEAGHDPINNLLTVRFASGPTWTYEGVTANQYENMLKSPSIGQFFLRNIKPHYKGRRVQ